MTRLRYISLLFAAAAPAFAAAPDFNRDVRPVISSNCISCHGPDEAHRKGKLRLDTWEGATAPAKSGEAALVPGDRNRSALWKRVNATGTDDIMPPAETGHTLKPEQIDVLGRWIDAGGKYDKHWSFKPPVASAVPAGTNAVDHFISQRLKQEGLALSPEGDRLTLARRVYLDLTGLPPAPEEAAAFAADTSPDAWEKLVDRLLASPAYGERWARMWLDLARYADSRGYGSDPLRMNIWRYRDWVIQAFNRNLPYDQFTTEQLAGDLLPNPTTEQLLATAFHRNTMTNTLGGTIDEEFRVAAVKDRAEATAQVWMGLTMKCAQCHTHKFDPLTNEEYYKFYAVFNQTADDDRPDEYPTAPTPTAAEQQKIDELKARIETLKREMATPPAEFLAQQSAWETKMRDETALWKTLNVSEAKSRKGQTLARQDDGTVRATPKKDKAPATDVYVIDGPADMTGITGLRLEALSGNAGGNFVVNEVKVFERPNGNRPAEGRYVRVELPGKQRFLHFAEMQVMSGGKNIAPEGKATQSSIDYGGLPERAIDGNTDGDYNKNSVTHTHQEADPWWEVDLGATKPVESLVYWGRTDGETASRMDGMVILVLDEKRQPVFREAYATAPKVSAQVAVDGRREVSVRAASASFEQTDFPASLAVDGNLADKSGWAVAPRQGVPQSLVLELSEPLCLHYGCTLTIELHQTYKEHTLSHFRLSATTRPAPLRAVPESLSPVLAKAADARTPAEVDQIRSFYAQLDPASMTKAKEVAALEKKLSAIKPAETPVMQELPTDKRRKTRLMVKGNYLVPGQDVSPGVPAAFHPMPAGAQPDRLGLARWLTARENPLTARVAVNRFWAQLFGRGLVWTEEDFGTQGTYPTHPELLDTLAVQFMQNGWDVKALLKSLVMSATYRQSSEVRPEHLEKDPQNVLLSRGPRFRLEAEMIRDQALAISGLLSKKMFGPSVYPPQPEGMWRAAFNGERGYPTSTGEDRYRRGLYIFLRRTVPYPSMSTFDAPNREICTIRRIRTNTPLQAFVTLNDPAFMEMAQAFARRMVKEGGATPEERIKWAWRQCVLRDVPAEKLATLADLYRTQLATGRADPAAAKQLANDPLHALPDSTDWAEMAALTLVANVLLNLDAVLMKG